MRGVDFLSLWSLEDRHTLSATLETIVHEGVVGHGKFFGITEGNREAAFEFALLPLIHTSRTACMSATRRASQTKS